MSDECERKILVVCWNCAYAKVPKSKTQAIGLADSPKCCNVPEREVITKE